MRPILHGDACQQLGLLAPFVKVAPASRAFRPQRHSLRSFLSGYASVLRDRVLLMLYGTGFLMMGAFVTIYNYVPYRLVIEPYALGHAEIGAIFLLYMLGSASSAWSGKLAGRIGVRPTFWRPVKLTKSQQSRLPRFAPGPGYPEPR